MKTFIVLSALIAIALANPPRRQYDQQQNGGYESQSSYQGAGQQQQKHIPIVKYESEQNQHGYRFGFESANGIQIGEQGQVKNEGQKDKEAVVAEGYYAFHGDDGKEYSVHYVADENGFRAAGDHLPTPPPLPLENQKLIEEAYARPTSKYDDEGQYYEEEGNQKTQYRQQAQQQQYQARPQYEYSH